MTSGPPPLLTYIMVVLSCFCLFNISFSLLLVFVWFLVLILVFLDIFPLSVVVSCVFVLECCRWGKGQCCRSG